MSNLAKSARGRAEALVAIVEHRKRDIARAFYDLGAALRELNEKKLFGSLGYASFDEMLAERALMSPAQARKLVEVVRSFDRTMAERLGAEKAYALARYVARTKQEDDVAELIEEGFPVGGRRRSIDETTVRQITHATQLAVLKQKGKFGDNERARERATTIARRVQARLRKVTVDEATVRIAFRHGSWWLDIALPAEMAEGALRNLAK